MAVHRGTHRHARVHQAATRPWAMAHRSELLPGGDDGATRSPPTDPRTEPERQSGTGEQKMRRSRFGDAAALHDRMIRLIIEYAISQRTGDRPMRLRRPEMVRRR